LKKTLLAILIVATFFTARQTACAQEPRPLRWAADAEGGAPYIFKAPKNNTKIGFEVDLAQALEQELGRKIEFTQSDYKNLINHLKLGDRDFVMNGWEVTPDRQKDVLFTRPYYAFTLQLVVRDDEKRFDTLLGCKKIKGVVGTLEDTAASRLLEKWGVKHRIYDGQVEPYQDLDDHVLDAVLLDLPIAIWYAQESPVTPKAPEFKFVDNIIGRGHYAIAVSRNNPALRGQLDVALGRVIEKGEMARILFKWNIWNPWQAELLPSGAFYDEALLKGERETEDSEEESFITLLLEGAMETVMLTVYSFALAVALGLLIATARLYGPLPVRLLATVYIEFFRGIPVLLLLAFLYFGLPAIAKSFGWDAMGFSLKMNAEVAAILGLGLNYAAYEAEIYRAGISAIPLGQWEAASSLGMGGLLTFRRIILPQAFRIILPPMTNDLVALFKDTSVVSVIAVVELSKQYQILTKSSSENLVTIALATAALYLIMSVPLGFLSRYLEKRWGVG